MYFQSFPYTYYTLDNGKTVQIVTNITQRIQFSDELKDNLSLFDEYDVNDGETPELVADKFYNNSELHWIVLLTNDIIDPRFDWVLSQNNLERYVSSKYSNVNAIHHYEDTESRTVNGKVYIESANEFQQIDVNDTLVNNTNTGTGYVLSKYSNSNVLVTVTTGGFQTQDNVALASNTSIKANITSTQTITGIPVTNKIYEERVNETKRRIRILKSDYVESVINDFKKKISS